MKDRKPRSTTAKSHPVNATTLDRLRAQKGWTDEQLATVSGVSEKTIGRARKGEPVVMHSIDLLARAFDVTCDKLLLFKEPYRKIVLPEMDEVLTPIRADRRIELKLTVGMPYEEFKQSERMVTFLTRLKRLVHGSDDIHAKGIEPGSTIVTLVMSTPDILRLFAEMLDGNLQDMINVSTVTLSEHYWLLRMIVSLKLRGTPLDFDLETWSEMISTTMVMDILNNL